MIKGDILLSAKLTKRFFMQLPEGKFLISNRFTPGFRPLYTDKVIGFRPIYAETVACQSQREGQWKEIVKAGVDQRLCRIFKTKLDYTAWLAKSLYTDRNGKYRPRP
jgi:hypothetical protein